MINLETSSLILSPLFSTLNVSDTILSLPQDLFTPICSYLNYYDLHSAMFANRTIKSRVIKAANVNECNPIKNFIQRLLQSFPQNRDTEKKMLAKILQNITSYESTSLLLLKVYIFEVKNKLAHVIKMLDIQFIDDLKTSIEPPQSMEDIFILASLERQIDEANLIQEGRKKTHMLFYR